MQWSDRSVEEARLLNPAFLVALLTAAAADFEKTGGEAMPWTMSFLVPALALPESTREALPGSVQAHLSSWLQDHPEVRIGFARRARPLVPLVQESLRLGLRSGALEIEAGRAPSDHAAQAPARADRRFGRVLQSRSIHRAVVRATTRCGDDFWAPWGTAVIQLRAVAIWNRDGQRRTIELRPGELNIITGEAKTGKSALLEIVEFCLGRSTVSLPEGVVTQTVDWYGVIVSAGDQSVFIGRPGPKQGQATVSGAHLALGGPDLVLPEHSDLELNANAEAVTEYLTRLTGIGEYENVPPSGTTRPPLRPTVRHASLYCFQRQNEIANPRQLFHRQEEDFMPQAIKDTLPYFIGAVDREAPTLRNRLYFLRREFRQAERRLEDARRLELRAPARSAALLSEAVDAGLVARPEEMSLIRGNSSPPLWRRRPSRHLASWPAESEYQRLAQQSQELTAEIRAIADRAGVLRTSGSDQSDYQARVDRAGCAP